MHYYKRNLGDYAKKAGRLTMLQHGSYTLLIDSCYDREQFPTLEEAIDWTWASTAEEKEAVMFVLGKFFTLIDGRYVQMRIQEEIAEYHAKAETNKRIATEREAKRHEARTNRARNVNEPPPNHKPITNNQEPLLKTKRPKPLEVSRPECVPEHLWLDFLKVRKSKDAPMTETALRILEGEAAKAGIELADAIETCIGRNWQSLKADWLEAPSQNTAVPKKSVVAWWSSDSSIEAKGKELGISPRPGEDWQQFKGRINHLIGQVVGGAHAKA